MPLNRIQIYHLAIHEPVELLFAAHEFLPGFTGGLFGLPREDMQFLRVSEFLAVNMGKNRIERPQPSGFLLMTELVIQGPDIHREVLDKHFVHHEMCVHTRSHNQFRGNGAYRDILHCIGLRLVYIPLAGKLRRESAVRRKGTNFRRNDLFTLQRPFEHVERERFGGACHSSTIQQSPHIVFIGKIHVEKAAPGHLLPPDDGLDVKSAFDVHTLKKGDGGGRPPCLIVKSLLFYKRAVGQFARALERNARSTDRTVVGGHAQRRDDRLPLDKAVALRKIAFGFRGLCDDERDGHTLFHQPLQCVERAMARFEGEERFARYRVSELAHKKLFPVPRHLAAGVDRVGTDLDAARRAERDGKNRRGGSAFRSGRLRLDKEHESVTRDHVLR